MMTAAACNCATCWRNTNRLVVIASRGRRYRRTERVRRRINRVARRRVPGWSVYGTINTSIDSAPASISRLFSASSLHREC